jgi:hypothetical protein
MTNRGRDAIRAAIALAALCLGSTVSGADALPESIRACAGIGNATQRLECFDRAVAGLGMPVATAAGAAAVAAPVLTPEQQFGAKGELKEKQQPKPAEPPPLEKLASTVKSVRTGPSGEFIVTLENGQVWRQSMAAPMQLRVGDTVTIKPMSFGSYWMTDATGRGSRVKRTQ